MIEITEFVSFKRIRMGDSYINRMAKFFGINKKDAPPNQPAKYIFEKKIEIGSLAKVQIPEDKNVTEFFTDYYKSLGPVLEMIDKHNYTDVKIGSIGTLMTASATRKRKRSSINDEVDCVPLHIAPDSKNLTSDLSQPLSLPSSNSDGNEQTSGENGKSVEPDQLTDILDDSDEFASCSS